MVIHKQSSKAWEFVVQTPGEEHATATHLVQIFTSALPGEEKQVIIGAICAVEGQACDLTGYVVQVLNHLGEVIADPELVGWSAEHQCYVTDPIGLEVPSEEGPYKWHGNFPRQ